MLVTDFWWLSADEAARYKYVDFMQCNPRCDKNRCVPSTTLLLSDINGIDEWRQKYRNINIYRSLKVKSDISGGQELIGPFVVDIDNEQENLQDAFDVAKNTFEYLRDSHCVEENHVRVFFTGRKGFNLEVLPKALAIRGSLEDCIKQSADKLDLIIDHLRQREEWRTSNQVSSNETVIDRIYGNRTFGYGLRHFWGRLHGSWNEWITPAGVRSRMKVHLTSDELRRLSISDIVARSEI